MATAFKTVIDAMEAALLTPPTIVGSRVEVGRDRPLPAEHESDITVTEEALDGEDMTLTGAPKSWTVTYGLRIRARATLPAEAYTAQDAIFGAAYARLEALAPIAGVEGFVLQPRARVEIDEAATPIATRTLAMVVRLRTQPGTLTLAA